MAIANLEKIYIRFRKSIVLRIDTYIPCLFHLSIQIAFVFYIVSIFAIADVKTTLHTFSYRVVSFKSEIVFP